MSTVTGDTSNSLLKFNGPFRVIETNDNNNDFKINDIHSFSTQQCGYKSKVSIATKVGETIKFENRVK